MGTPADFCQNASECLELAERTSNEVHKKLLLDLAAKWLHLAGVTRDEIAAIKGTRQQLDA